MHVVAMTASIYGLLRDAAYETQRVYWQGQCRRDRDQAVGAAAGCAACRVVLWMRPRPLHKAQSLQKKHRSVGTLLCVALPTWQNPLPWHFQQAKGPLHHAVVVAATATPDAASVSGTGASMLMHGIAPSPLHASQSVQKKQRSFGPLLWYKPPFELLWLKPLPSHL